MPRVPTSNCFCCCGTWDASLPSPWSTREGVPALQRSEDYELVAEYIDAIRHLVVAAQAERPDKDEVQRLSNMVLHIQQVREGLLGCRVVTLTFV